MEQIAPFKEDFLGRVVAGPGRVLLHPLDTSEEKSRGGIVLARTEESKFVRAQLGRVVSCGELYDGRSGMAESELFPIPKGWLVAFHPHDTITAGVFGGNTVLVVKTQDILWASPPEEEAGARAPARGSSQDRLGSAAHPLPARDSHHAGAR